MTASTVTTQRVLHNEAKGLCPATLPSCLTCVALPPSRILYEGEPLPAVHRWLLFRGRPYDPRSPFAETTSTSRSTDEDLSDD